MSNENGRIAGITFWLLGAWFFLSVSMAYVAGSTFGSLKVETLRNANEVFSSLEAEKERPLALRYIASELNRKFFLHYGNAQLVLGLLALIFVLRTKRRKAIIVLAIAYVIALWFRFDLIPSATEIGREIDFVPREPITERRAEFNTIHRLSTSSEVIKMVLLLITGFFLRPSKTEDA